MVVRRSFGFVALTLAVSGCAGPPASGSPLASPSPSPSVSASEVAAVASAERSASQLTPLAEVLPTEVDGLALHTFAVGEDILARLAIQLCVEPADLETAFASEHGALFFQMYAIRLPGTTAAELAEGWSLVAYPPDITDVEIAGETIDGTAITVVNSPSAAYRLGTFYLDANGPGETLIVVQAFDISVAVEALASVP